MYGDESQQKEDNSSPQDSDLPTTLETLGNHLHAQITSYFPHLLNETVSKLTGVLLECSEKEIFTMLQDFELLQKRVTMVLPLINPTFSSSTNAKENNENTISHSSSSNPEDFSDWTDNNSEELFDKVAAIDPIFCAKITGMLLEKKPAFLKQCLTNTNLLNSALEKARSTYLKSLEMNSVSSLVENTDKPVEEQDGGEGQSSNGVLNKRFNELGNLVFSQVVMWYPKLANKITGMLLEINLEELELIVNDSDYLKSQADKAFLALKHSGYITHNH